MIDRTRLSLNAKELNNLYSKYSFIHSTLDLKQSLLLNSTSCFNDDNKKNIHFIQIS